MMKIHNKNKNTRRVVCLLVLTTLLLKNLCTTNASAADDDVLVVEPRTNNNDWSDKFITAVHYKDMLKCNDSVGGTYPGWWAMDNDIAIVWLKSSKNSEVRQNCQVEPYPDNTYVYCDEKKKDSLSMCVTGRSNMTYFNERGFAGNDCTSFTYLSDWLEGLIDFTDIDKYCLTTDKGVPSEAGLLVPDDEVPIHTIWNTPP